MAPGPLQLGFLLFAAAAGQHMTAAGILRSTTTRQAALLGGER